MLHLRQHDPKPYRDALLDACLQTDVYDPQMNGTFGTYLYELIEATSDATYFRDRIAADLLAIEDHHDLARRIDILVSLAVNGDMEARAAVEATLRNLDSRPLWSWVVDACVDLDGLDGLIAAIERLTSLVEPDDDLSDLDGVLWSAEERFGDGVTWSVLENAAAQSDAVRRYVDTIRWRRASKGEQPARSVVDDFSFDLLMRVMIEGAPRKYMSPPLWWRWSRTATDEQILTVAEMLRDMPDSDDKRRLVALAVFRNRTFPLDHRILLRLLASPHDRVALLAYSALERIAHPDVRALAFELMRHPDPDHRCRAIDMLLSNYEDDDHMAIEDLVARETDEDACHAYGMSLFDLMRRRDDPRLLESHRLLLDKNPCASCRETLIATLIKHDALPESSARECLWDANLDIRELARKQLAGEA